MKRILFILFTILSCTALHAQSQHVECEDTCTHVHGIDMSHYQGNVFWEAVGQTKMAYVYLKATEGSKRVDPKYLQNIQYAHQYGLKVGSYHFYRPKVNQEEQLANFMAQCRPGDQDLLPMIDVEASAGMKAPEFRDSLFKFLQLVEKAYKQKPLVYTYTNFYKQYLRGTLNDYKVMIAQYTAKEPEIEGLDAVAWQYTGKGHLDGVNTYVDKSRFLGDHKLREIRFRHK